MTEEKDKLGQRIEFIMEIDKLKSIQRRTLLVDRSRNENSAEHSWHVATAAMVLAPYAGEDVDIDHVIRMLLVHDIVEIDAGDTFAYDTAGYEDKLERETAAMQRLFGYLPELQRAELSALWLEFEDAETPSSRYANAIDRILPLLHNYHTQGATWHQHGISRSQVVERNAGIQNGLPDLWSYIVRILDDSVEKGYLLGD